MDKAKVDLKFVFKWLMSLTDTFSNFTIGPYWCVCVCVCVSMSIPWDNCSFSFVLHTHTHTHTNISIYKSRCVCVIRNDISTNAQTLKT